MSVNSFEDAFFKILDAFTLQIKSMSDRQDENARKLAERLETIEKQNIEIVQRLEKVEEK